MTELTNVSRKKKPTQQMGRRHKQRGPCPDQTAYVPETIATVTTVERRSVTEERLDELVHVYHE